MAATTKGACNHPHCYPDTGCALGEKLHECPHYTSGEEKKDETPVPLAEGEGVPWTGSAFGVDDIAWAASRSRPSLYAPIGAHNAGKTTFLASLYIGLCRGVLPAKHQFVGSFTFGGWEKLAAYVRHAPDGLGPGFPPHTPVTENRLPGWLHVGLRSPFGEVRDILLADAPGEWYSRWSIRPDADVAEGARWVARYADEFLFFVDSAGLAGADRRVVADQTELLAQRLASVRAGRPVAIIWAKSDQEIRPALRTDLEVALKGALPDSAVFQTSVHTPQTNTEPTRAFWDTLEWFLIQGHPVSPLRAINTTAPEDPFLAYRS